MKRGLLAALAALFSAFAAAQGFPERPVRIVVPLTPGGSPDTIARAIAQGLSGVWTQPVVVENRTGGSQNIGSDLVAKSPPDGYTWLLAPDNVFSVNPYLGKQPFDPLVDLMPVTQVARIQFLLVVNPDLPAKSVPELIALARSKPGQLRVGYGSTLVLYDAEREEEVTYRLVTPEESDPAAGLISTVSPIGRSLMGKEQGDEVVVTIPSGSRRFEIRKLTTLHDQPK